MAIYFRSRTKSSNNQSTQPNEDDLLAIASDQIETIDDEDNDDNLAESPEIDGDINENIPEIENPDNFSFNIAGIPGRNYDLEKIENIRERDNSASKLAIHVSSTTPETEDGSISIKVSGESLRTGLINENEIIKTLFND